MISAKEARRKASKSLALVMSRRRITKEIKRAIRQGNTSVMIYEYVNSDFIKELEDAGYKVYVDCFNDGEYCKTIISW